MSWLSRSLCPVSRPAHGAEHLTSCGVEHPCARMLAKELRNFESLGEGSD